MRGPLILLALLSLAATARAADTGRLVLHVRHGGAPVAQASVSVTGRAIDSNIDATAGPTAATDTDAEGNASLALPPGEQQVVVYHPGFLPATLKLVVLPGRDTRVEVELHPAEPAQESVTVLATRSGRIVQDQPVRVETVPEEEVEENTAAAPGNLTTLLAELPGVDVQAVSSSLGGAALRLRGLPGRYTQVLSDELPLFGEQPDAFSLLQVPPLDLARVEVVKGPASALYGGAALGGLVNVVSLRPPAEPELLLGATSLGGADAVGFVPLPLGSGWGCTLLGGLHGQRRKDVDGDGWTDVPGFRRGELRPRFFWKDDAGSSLFLTAGGTSEHREGGTVDGGVTPALDRATRRVEGATPVGAPFEESLDTRRVDAGGVGRFLVGAGRRLVVVRGAIADTRHDLVFGGNQERSRRRYGLLEASLGGTHAGHAWLVGAAVERDAYTARDVAGFDYAFTTPAVFVQDEFDPAPWLALSAGARAEFHDAYGTLLGTRVSALFRPAPGWAVRASAGSGHAVPVPLTEETQVVGLSRVQPLQGLEPERARTAMLDAQWARGPWELSAGLFGSSIAHPLILREVPPDAAGRPLRFIGAPTPTRTWGAEALARFTHGALQAIASYTYVHSVGETPTGPARADVALTPRHAAEIAWIWEREERGRFGLELTYTGHQRLDDDPYRAEAPSYVTANALGEIRIGEAAVFANVIDVTGVRQSGWDPLVRPQPAPDGRWTTDVWAPLAGRTFNTGVRWEF